MDFSFSSAQQDIQARAIRDAGLFAGSEHASRPFAHSPSWHACADQGWTGLVLSEVHSGGGYDALETIAGLEALGENGVDRGAMFALGAHLFGCVKPLEIFGQDALLQEWGPKLAAGQSVGALALTETGGGSDLAALKTTIVGPEDGLVLTGHKSMITNAQVCDLILVLAREPDRAPPFNLTVVGVPSVRSGVHITPLPDRAGLRGGGMAEIAFDECKISPSEILGRRGAGLAVVMAAMRWERTCILAGALGALNLDLRRVTKALTERGSLAGGLIRYQAVSHRLADVRQKIEGARLVLYRAAWELDRGTDTVFYPALSKLTVAETLVEGAVTLQTFMAGAGHAVVPGLAQAVQDAVAMSAASGTSEIMKNLIVTKLQRS